MERSVSRKKESTQERRFNMLYPLCGGRRKGVPEADFSGKRIQRSSVERKSFSQAERKAKRDRALFRRCNRFYRAEKSCGRKDKAEISGLKRKTQSLH